MRAMALVLALDFFLSFCRPHRKEKELSLSESSESYIEVEILTVVGPSSTILGFLLDLVSLLVAFTLRASAWMSVRGAESVWVSESGVVESLGVSLVSVAAAEAGVAEELEWPEL